MLGGEEAMNFLHLWYFWPVVISRKKVEQNTAGFFLYFAWHDEITLALLEVGHVLENEII